MQTLCQALSHNASPVGRDLTELTQSSKCKTECTEEPRRAVRGGHWEASCVASEEGFGDGKTEVSTKAQAASGFAGVTMPIRPHLHCGHGRARGGCLECVPEKTNGVRTQDQDGLCVWSPAQESKGPGVGPWGVTSQALVAPSPGLMSLLQPSGLRSVSSPPSHPSRDTTSSAPCQSVRVELGHNNNNNK